MTEIQNTQSPGANRTIVVIDFESHTRGGHFGHWLTFFSIEFARRFRRVLICTPNAEATRQLFQSSKVHLPDNLAFFALPKGRRKRLFGRRKKCNLEEILRNAEESVAQETCAFVMWGYDLLEPGIAQNGLHRRWATLVGLSWEQRNFRNDAAERDQRLRELCQNDQDCVCMLTPDQFIVSKQLAKARYVPDPEELGLPGETLPVIEQIREQSAGRFIIGLVGMLNGPRGVDEALLLAKQHAGVFVVLAGKLLEESLSGESRRMLETAKPDNFLLIPGFLEEPTLNAIVNACDALLIDGSHYPVQSSVANKALHFGKFLLTPESCSWMRDVIARWNVGLAYRKRDVDLVSAWQAWKTSGGPERSRSVAAELMSGSALRDCFDELTRALTV